MSVSEIEYILTNFSVAYSVYTPAYIYLPWMHRSRIRIDRVANRSILLTNLRPLLSNIEDIEDILEHKEVSLEDSLEYKEVILEFL